MLLFNGIACFSPLVAPATRDVWVRYGGNLAAEPKTSLHAHWFFANDIKDPWLARFASRPIIVSLSGMNWSRDLDPLLSGLPYPSLLHALIPARTYLNNKVFHTNWILASAASKFTLPLANFVLDARSTEIIGQNIPENKKRNQGSHYAGMFRKRSEINAHIDNNVAPTRLAATFKGRKSCKHSLSPEQNVDRITKKTRLRSVEKFEGSSSDGRASAFASAHLENRACSSLLATSLESAFFQSNTTSHNFDTFPDTVLGQDERVHSDTRESENSESTISFESMMNHDHSQLCEKLVNKELGYTAEILSSCTGSSSELLKKPDEISSLSESSRAGGQDPPKCSSKDIWLVLSEKFICSTGRDKSDIEDVRTVGVSDVLAALRELNAKSVSDGNGDVALFVMGRMHLGRKFDVDKGDRRKTI